jgi:transcriptional regulator with XRE-family HTH domain
MRKKGSHRAVDLRPEYERLGRWLRALREKNGISQRALSIRLGKPVAYIHKVEMGRQRMDLVEFVDFAKQVDFESATPFLELFDAIRTSL